MANVKTFKVIIGFKNGELGHCEAVEYQGAVWLVPTWLPNYAEKYAMPERMIRLDQFRHDQFDPPATGPGQFAGANFAVRDPLPKELFHGELTERLKAQYVVLEKPDAKFRVGGAPN